MGVKLSAQQRRALVMADCTRDVDAVAAAVIDAVNDTPGATALDAEMALRDAGAQAFLIAIDDRIEIYIGIGAMITALDAAGITPSENRAALAAID